jgi:hypothetical protein
MNKNRKAIYPKIAEANKGAKRKSTKAKVAAKERSGDSAGMGLIEQHKWVAGTIPRVRDTYKKQEPQHKFPVDPD